MALNIRAKDKNKINLKQKEEKVISHFENYSKRTGIYLITKDLGREYPLLKFIGEIVKQKKDNTKLRILEIACGGGNLLENINNYFPGNELYGIDLTPSFIEYAKKHRSKEIDFRVGSVMNLPYENNTFDIVLMENLLHHLVGGSRESSKDLIENALKEITRVLKKDGFIIINEALISHKFKSYLLFWSTNILSKINFLNIEIPQLQINKDIIVSFLTQKELINIMEKLGIEKIYQNINIWKVNSVMSIIMFKILQYPDRNIYYMGKLIK